MRFTKLILFSAALLIGGSAFAQKIKVTSGNLKDLKGVEKIKITYDYTNLSVGDFKNENDYIAKKMADAEKSKPGTGESWKSKWYNDRTARFEPKFEELFSKHSEKVQSGKNVESDVVMNVHTIFIEPGFNVGVMRKSAFINLIITFTKAGKEVAVVEMTKSPGADVWGADFDAGYRISEAYARAGKVMGAYLTKSLK
jgi:hypothetical protein